MTIITKYSKQLLLIVNDEKIQIEFKGYLGSTKSRHTTYLLLCLVTILDSLPLGLIAPMIHRSEWYPLLSLSSFDDIYHSTLHILEPLLSNSKRQIECGTPELTWKDPTGKP
jgi:hypothetical protein